MVAQKVKDLPAIWDTWVRPGLGRSPGKGIGYPLQYYWDSLVAQMVKQTSAYNVGDPGSIPGSGRSSQIRSDQISHSVVYDSSRPHE